MNRNVLKYIAIIAMTLDHVAAHLDFISPTIYLIFRIIGRITMPIMCFFIAEGFFYTKSKKNYALRLLILAIISQPIWCLLHNDTILTWEIFLNLNTVFSLLLGFLLLWIIEGNQKLYIKSLLIVLVVTCSFLCDYKLVALLYVVFFYLTRDNKYKFAYLPIVYIVGTVISSYLNVVEVKQTIISAFMNIGLFFTIPLFITYNNKSGSNSKFHKYSFYVYYPTHLIILFVINYFLYR